MPKTQEDSTKVLLFVVGKIGPVVVLTLVAGAAA